MKRLQRNQLENHSGKRLEKNSEFSFRCHPEIGCFNKCCRNLNLFLYPYDVIRLKHCLKVSSDVFLERYVDVVLRERNFFPDVLLKMAENEEKTCPFLKRSGCSVYGDRPDACRTFPVEQALKFHGTEKKPELIHFYRPPVFCLGQFEDATWTPQAWEKDQGAAIYHEMTREWAKIKALFHEDPWGDEGPEGKTAKMAFMAVYNVDRFRMFILGSSFLNRFRVKSNILKKLKKSDTHLLRFGYDWVKYFLWHMPSKQFHPK
jgi:Fe-S-cluster containining protein